MTKKQSVGNWRSGGEVPVGQGNILLVMVGFETSVIGMVSPAFLCPDLSNCILFKHVHLSTCNYSSVMLLLDIILFSVTFKPPGGPRGFLSPCSEHG